MSHLQVIQLTILTTRPPFVTCLNSGPNAFHKTWLVYLITLSQL